MRLAIFMSHPIQYQVSLLRLISNSKKVNLKVYFYWDFGFKQSYDPEFDSVVKWDLPLLSGYKNQLLRNFSLKKGTHFFGCINPGVIPSILLKKHDVVMIFGWAIFSNWLVILAAKLSKTPILLFAESPMSHETVKLDFKNKVRRIILKKLFKLINGFLYIGKENRDFYQSFNISKNKLFYAPYAVDNTRHLNSKNEIESNGISDKLIGIKRPNSVVILFVGKLIEKKRPMDLLKAFEKLKNEKLIKDISLWYVGDGDQRTQLQNYVNNYKINDVKFWGFQNQTELPHFYSLGDIFVLPSGYGETWGLVVNEAMCYGKPIIVSNLVGCGKDLVTKNNGFIVPFADDKKMSDAIKILTLNDQLRNSFGKESLNIIQNYSQEICAENIIFAASSILKNNG